MSFDLDSDDQHLLDAMQWPYPRTTFWRGAYDTHPDLRVEFFTVCGVRR